MRSGAPSLKVQRSIHTRRALTSVTLSYSAFHSPLALSFRIPRRKVVVGVLEGDVANDHVMRIAHHQGCHV